jgi:hypothetical protein
VHFYGLNDAFEIARELLIRMMRRYNRYILPVIAKVEDHQIKIGKQILPIGKVGVSSEAIAMAKDQTHAIRAAMTSDTDFGAILERNIKDYTGRWKLENHRDLCKCPAPWWFTTMKAVVYALF